MNANPNLGAKKSMTRVTAVITTHNRKSLLEHAIRSVLAQTHLHLELIIVDDASSDGTEELVARYRQRYPQLIYVRHAKSLGGGASRNAGLEKATGEYIAYLDDDDTWRPELIARQLQQAVKYPSAAGFTCGWTVHPPGEVSASVHHKSQASIPPEPVSLEEVFRYNMFGGASMLFCSTATLRRIGGFDPHLRSCQDWDVWLRLALHGSIKVLREPLVCYTVHPVRITTNKFAAYHGHRRFFLKHAHRMGALSRRRSLVIALHHRSRTPLSSPRRRLVAVALAWCYLPVSHALSLTRLSLRQATDSLRGRRLAPSSPS